MESICGYMWALYVVHVVTAKLCGQSILSIYVTVQSILQLVHVSEQFYVEKPALVHFLSTIFA